MNYWKVKKLQRRRRDEYQITKFLRSFFASFDNEGRSLMIRIFVFFNESLKYVRPLFVSSVIIICALFKISIMYLLLGFSVVLFFNNHEQILEDVDFREIEFLAESILSKQTANKRREKTYFFLIFQNVIQNTVIFVLCWVIVVFIERSLVCPLIGIVVTILEPVFEFLFLFNQNLLIKAFLRNDLSFLEKERLPAFSNSWGDTLGLALFRMLCPVKRNFIRPFSIFLLFLLGVFIFSINKFPGLDGNIFLLYYCSIFPSFYHFFVKKIMDRTDFFVLSEMSNYYYMKKFALRSRFVKEFSRVIFINILVVVFLLLIPIFFFRSFLSAFFLSLLAFVTLYFLVRLSVLQKTGVVNDTLEELKLGSILSPLEMLEDFFVVGCATYLSSFILFYYVKHEMTSLPFLFPIFYFCFVIFYTFMKGRLIRVKNQ